jgi:diaminopimelate decarboxylase
VFSGVGKTDDEIALGLEHGVAELNAESEAEIERIAEVAARLGRRARLSLRVNPNIDAGSHPYISTGLAQNKFGVDIALAEAILARARAHPSLQVVGVQCHIGSQILDTAPLAAAARELASLARRLLSLGSRSRRSISAGASASTTRRAPRAPTRPRWPPRSCPSSRACRSRCCWSPDAT